MSKKMHQFFPFQVL